MVLGFVDYEVVCINLLGVRSKGGCEFCGIFRVFVYIFKFVVFIEFVCSIFIDFLEFMV